MERKFYVCVGPTAGVSPGRSGTKVAGLPVFESVARACAETGADTSMIFVPAPSVAGAAIEAIEAVLPN